MKEISVPRVPGEPIDIGVNPNQQRFIDVFIAEET